VYRNLCRRISRHCEIREDLKDDDRLKLLDRIKDIAKPIVQQRGERV